MAKKLSLSKMKIADLKKLAEEAGIEGFEEMTSKKLVVALKVSEKKAEEEASATEGKENDNEKEGNENEEAKTSEEGGAEEGAEDDGKEEAPKGPSVTVRVPKSQKNGPRSGAERTFSVKQHGKDFKKAAELYRKRWSGVYVK